MTSHLLSEDSQVVLLLCGRFGREIPDSLEPLNPSEFNRLTTWLSERDLQLSDLISDLSSKIFQTASIANMKVDRIETLLKRGASLAMALETWTNNGLWVMTRKDESYPQQLVEKLGVGSPPILYGAGARNQLSHGGLAIVGSRDVDECGLYFANQVAVRCAKQGIQVVSGGARGIDQEAMTSALDEGGDVIGILAHGLMQSVRSKRYREAIVEEQLVLVSAYDPYAGFNVGNAMARNKQIYALSDWSLAVSASLEKGGTWNGAIENLKNKWAPLFVWMDEAAPQGNRELVSKGAVPLRDEDILLDDVSLSDWFNSHNSGDNQESVEQLSLL
jgi:predicted Rossmann fold nucleotide-binding protein DprA/Smf involved in DNA uptake